jgi:predicted transcriptional regulator
MSFKLTPDERDRLEEIARDRNVTFTEAIREGLKLYAQEWREQLRDQAQDGPRLAGQ